MPAGKFSFSEPHKVSMPDDGTAWNDLQTARESAYRDRLIAEKRCVKCGLHCPKRYDHMKSHLCGDCFWNS